MTKIPVLYKNEIITKTNVSLTDLFRYLNKESIRFLYEDEDVKDDDEIHVEDLEGEMDIESIRDYLVKTYLVEGEK